jgi:hypothetical protein
LAWAAHAEGDNDGALQWMRSAADLKDKTDKHPVTPGPVLPARVVGRIVHGIGSAGTCISRVRSGAAEFSEEVQRDGAARSAELSGDRKRANDRYSELLQLCGEADTQRLEMQNARAYLQER